MSEKKCQSNVRNLAEIRMNDRFFIEKTHDP